MCKHDKGFALHVYHCADRVPIYFCLAKCGFSMSFDPSVAGSIREHIRVLRNTPLGEELWRKKTLAYVLKEDGKTITLVPSKY